MQEYDYDKQHKKGKLHAMERIQLILDEGTFVETDADVTNDNNGFGIKAGTIPYDGVITGYGRVHGELVYIYSQDFTVMGGSLGRNHGFKIARTIESAIKHKCPVIGINDSGGARIQEGVDSLAGYGEIFYYNTMASGYIPQISIIAGPCAGGAVYSPGITDFIFVIDNISRMFVTGPKVIKSVTNEVVTAEELGGSDMHSCKSGVAHFRCETEHECYASVRNLLDMIPHCYEKKKTNLFAKKNSPDFHSAHKSQKRLAKIMPESHSQTYDMRDVLETILDDESFVEVQKEFATNAVIGLGKLGGVVVGVVANQPKVMAGVLDCDSSDKIARWVRYLDNYNIPIITFEDVPGFMPSAAQESKGIIRHGAKMLYAYSEATTTKITVIMRKAYGGAYIAMNSKRLRADKVYAWPKAEIAVMGAEAACEVLYAKKLKNLEGEEKQKFFQQKVDKYTEECMNARKALSHGYVDEIIEPAETRNHLLKDLKKLDGKTKEHTIHKKHGNIPL